MGLKLHVMTLGLCKTITFDIAFTDCAIRLGKVQRYMVYSKVNIMMQTKVNKQYAKLTFLYHKMMIV